VRDWVTQLQVINVKCKADLKMLSDKTGILKITLLKWRMRFSQRPFFSGMLSNFINVKIKSLLGI
jgi:hypothetical protein